MIISYFNADNRLHKALLSILDQSFKPKQLILINDASNNGFVLSKDILNQLKLVCEVNLINNPTNEGLTRSLIKGITYAKGNLIARLDADDFWLPGHLESSIQGISEANYDLIGGSCYVKKADQKKFPVGRSSVRKMPRFRFSNAIVHSSVVFSQSFYNHAGGYDENFTYAQDFELWLRFQRLGAKIGYLASNTVVRTINKKSIGEVNILRQFYFSQEAIKKNTRSKIEYIVVTTIRRLFFLLRITKRKFID